MSLDQSGKAMVPETRELRVTALSATTIGALALIAGLVLDGNPGAWLALAIVEAAAVGTLLHAIDMPRRLRAVEGAEPPEGGALLEPEGRTILRQILLLLASTLLLGALVELGWGEWKFVPGILLGLGAWLWLDAQSLSRWEEEHNATVVHHAGAIRLFGEPTRYLT
jgi:hypothetical protein